MQYIILDGKTPTHGFKDGKGTKTWEEAKDFDNVAVVVPAGYVVYDFDTTSDAEIMLRIVEGLDLKCRVMKTTRGIHVWFKSSEEAPKNFIKNRLAVGIYSDRKAGARNAYVKIKQDGKKRPWIRKDKEVQEVPKWLASVSAPSGKFNFMELGEGSGRNQELFNYIVYLQAKGFKKDDIKEIIQIINDYVLAEPLSDSEIATICRDEAFKPDDVIEEQIAQAEKKKSGFDHISIAEAIIEKHRLLKYNNILYEYDGGYYKKAELIRRYVREEYVGAKNNQVNEVVSYISDMQAIRRGEIKIDPYVINLENTCLDIRTCTCLPFNPEVIEFNRIPVTYNPSAYCADLDKTLNRVFCGDRELIDLFGEIFGYTLMRHARYQKAFLFIGNGSNGKSTIIDLIKAFYGIENYTGFPLETVTDRFNLAELENMYCNIGDDINNEIMRNTGTLKKLFAGNSLQVERKGEDPYTTTLTATHIYSANDIPRSFDKTDGFYRRFIIMPFNAKFSPTDEDYDPNLIDKITTPEALSYLLNIGLRGAKRLMANGKFTEPKIVVDLLDRYKSDNSTVLSWIEDKELSEDYLLEKPRDVLYSEFSDWCKVSGIKSNSVTGKKGFFKEISAKYDFEDRPKQRTDGKRYFMQKL